MRLTNEMICYTTTCIIITMMYFNSFTFIPRGKSEVVITNGQSRDTGNNWSHYNDREQTNDSTTRKTKKMKTVMTK